MEKWGIKDERKRKKGRAIMREKREGDAILSCEASLTTATPKFALWYPGLFSFQWTFWSFLWDHGTWNTPWLFCFSSFKWEGLLTSPFPECDVSSELTVRMKLAPPGWHTNACVPNTNIYLPLPCNWLSRSGISLCWISSPWNRSHDSRCGSDNV